MWWRPCGNVVWLGRTNELRDVMSTLMHSASVVQALIAFISRLTPIATVSSAPSTSERTLRESDCGPRLRTVATKEHREQEGNAARVRTASG